MTGVVVRRFAAGEEQQLCDVFYRSVHEVASTRYNVEQVNAWAPAVPDGAKWLKAFLEFDTFVAERDGVVSGWIAVTALGYVDMLFCLPEAVGRGIAAQLYAAAERCVYERRLQRMTAHASLLAQPFFLKHGWTIDYHEHYDKNGVITPRAHMSKELPPL